jgi:hypothetical protein
MPKVASSKQTEIFGAAECSSWQIAHYLGTSGLHVKHEMEIENENHNRSHNRSLALLSLSAGAVFAQSYARAPLLTCTGFTFSTRMSTRSREQSIRKSGRWWWTLIKTSVCRTAEGAPLRCWDPDQSRHKCCRSNRVGVFGRIVKTGVGDVARTIKICIGRRSAATVTASRHCCGRVTAIAPASSNESIKRIMAVPGSFKSLMRDNAAPMRWILRSHADR